MQLLLYFHFTRSVFISASISKGKLDYAHRPDSNCMIDEHFPNLYSAMQLYSEKLVLSQGVHSLSSISVLKFIRGAFVCIVSLKSNQGFTLNLNSSEIVDKGESKSTVWRSNYLGSRILLCGVPVNTRLDIHNSHNKQQGHKIL